MTAPTDISIRSAALDLEALAVEAVVTAPTDISIRSADLVQVAAAAQRE